MSYSKIRLICFFMLPVIAMLCFAGCFGGDGSDYIFKYDIPSNPRTLDPQTASDSSSQQLIANMFDGLLRLDGEGNVVEAVAESWSVSDDGLTYTFKLREDVFWYDGMEFEQICTADDFVFAFQRLFKPATKSKVASSFFCIKNSEAINTGKITDLDMLGVKAEDKFNLTITLEYPNTMFPVLLTTPPAMPCNKEYYESTAGKYGLYDDTVASNGAFYLYSWNYDQWSSENNIIIMRRNGKNNGDGDIYPYGLNYFIGEEDEYQNFLGGESHVYITSGEEAVGLLDKGYSYTSSDNRVWGILFNTKSVFKNKYLRQALAHMVDRENAELNATGYNKAYHLIPDIIKTGSLSYREQYPDNTALTCNTALAQDAYDQALKTLSPDDLYGLTLIMPEDSVLQDYASYITQQWQSGLNFYCNIKVLPKDQFDDALQSGDYDFALANLDGGYNSPSAYLDAFTTGDNENYSGYRDTSLEALITNGQHAETDEKSADFYHQAEQYLMEQAVFIPLAYQSEYAFFADGCSDIMYNPFTKTIIFREAKHD